VLACALGSGAAMAVVVTAHGTSAKQRLWGYEILRSSVDPSAGRLRHLKSHGVNVIVADPVQLTPRRIARDRATAARVGLRFVVLSRGTRALVGVCGSGCGIVVASPQAAVAFAAAHPSVLVALRLSSPDSLRFLAAAHRGTVLALIHVGTSFQTTAWRRALAAAAKNPSLGLAISPSGPASSVNQVTDSFLQVLNQVVPGTAPTEPAPPPPPPTTTPTPTPTPPPAPGQPTNLHTVSVGALTTVIAWTAPASGADHYDIFVNNVALSSTTLTTATLTTLICGVASTIGVDAASTTAHSAPVTISVTPPCGGGGAPADTTPPAVALSSPAAGALAGTVTVSATASDNVGVVGVQFKLDGVNLGAELTSSPYSYSWNTVGVAAGSHTLTAVARDAAGNTTTSTAVVVTLLDTTAPTVSVTAPSAAAHVSGSSVTVSASALDDVGVTSVQFKLDGVNLGAADTTAPFSISWDSTGVADGSHTLTAVASDAALHATTSAGIAVTVDNTPPTVVSINRVDSTPTNASSVQFTVTFSEAVSGVTASSFSLAATGTAAGSIATVSGSGPYTVTVNTVSGAGTLGLDLKASGSNGVTDTAGNATAGFSGLTYTVDRVAPTVSVTAPSAAAVVSGATVTVSATAADVGQGVASTQFKLDGVNLGAAQAGGSPSVTWDSTGASDGSHTITAVTTDAVGNATTSSGVTVTVDNAAPTVLSINRAGSSPTNATSVQFTVTFSEAVTGVATSSFSVTATGTAAGAVSNVSGTGASYTVTVNTVSGDGSLRLDLKASGSNGVTDVVGNSAAAFTTGQTYTIDTTAPTVSSINRVGSTPTNAASVQFTVTFSEAVSGVATSSFAVTVTGSATGTVSGVSGTGPYTVTVNSLTGAGTIRLDLKASGSNGVTDTAGNATAAFTTGQTYTVDRVAPTVSMTAPSAGATVSGASVTVSATAADTGQGVASTQFKLDGTTNIGAAQAGTSPSVTWDSTGASNGSHTITAVTTDNVGNTTTSSGVTVTVSNGGGSSPTTLANVWLDPAGATGSCARQAAGAYNAAIDCPTIASAYGVAHNGDTILVRAGTYDTSAEPIASTNAAITSTGSTVTMMPASGATVIFDLKKQSPDFEGVQALTINGNNTDGTGSMKFFEGAIGIIPQGGSNCTGSLGTFAASDHFTMENLTLNGPFTIDNGQNILMKNISLGSYSYADGGTQDTWGDSSRVDNYTGTDCPGPSANITFDGITWHDIYRGDSNSHVECIFIHQSDNVVLQNSTFNGCPTYDVMLQSNAPGQSNLTIQNNVFTLPCPDYNSVTKPSNVVLPGGGQTDCGSTAINEANCNNGNFLVSNWTIRFNTFVGGPNSFLACQAVQYWDSSDRLYGNVGGQVSGPCASNAPPANMANWTIGYNVWFGPKCAATDTTSNALTELNASYDLLNGALANDFVPIAFGTGCPATDRHGTSRPQTAGLCDAGSDER
jgi:hypothetical protein